MRVNFVTKSTFKLIPRSLVELNSAISKKDWTPEEDELVYRLHNQYGNKWAIIAEQLKGRYFNL